MTQPDARTRLARIIDRMPHQIFYPTAKSEEIAAALLAAGVTLPEEPKRERFPVTEEAVRACRTEWARHGYDWGEDVGADHEGLAAAAPFLVRSWIEGLASAELYTIWQVRDEKIRAALLKLAEG